MNAVLNKNISEFLTGLQTGSIQVYNTMVVFPLYSNQIAFEGIIGLENAFKKACIKFKEVSQSGSVPELLAVNSCNNKVLIIEGQELKGAKQNRTLNTHILLPEKSKTVIPVSCTEQGRWRYEKNNFDMTDKLVSHKMRRAINTSVKQGLYNRNSFKSNQHEVWEEIKSYMASFNKKNNTSSYHTLFEELKNEMRDYDGKFPIMENQMGIVVFIDGKLEGVEVITDANIYKQNHDKIIKSYIIDDLKLQKSKIKKGIDEFRLENLKVDYSKREEEMKDIIRHFFEMASEAKQMVFKSPGLGYEHRLTQSNVEGNFLVYNEKPLVTHLFPNDANGRMNDKMLTNQFPPEVRHNKMIIDLRGWESQ